MHEPASSDSFCLYLWRTIQAPGTVYLAGSIDQATAVYNELVDDGYIVKVVDLATNTEYQMLHGALMPAPSMRPTAGMDRLT